MRDADGKPRFPARRIYLRAAALFFLGAVLLGLPQRAAAAMLPQWELGVGFGGLWMPDYRGSDEVRGYLLPFPYVIYRLEWLKVDRDGVRSTLFDSKRAEVNLSLNATPPVRSKNNRAREGMSDLKPMVELGPSLNLHLWRSSSGRVRLDLRLPVRAAITVESSPRQAGLNASPFLNIDVDGIAGKPWQLGVLAGPIFGTHRHHQYFYGVSDSGHVRIARPTMRTADMAARSFWRPCRAVSRRRGSVRTPAAIHCTVRCSKTVPSYVASTTLPQASRWHGYWVNPPRWSSGTISPGRPPSRAAFQPAPEPDAIFLCKGTSEFLPHQIH